jgi:hypothetical protein
MLHSQNENLQAPKHIYQSSTLKSDTNHVNHAEKSQTNTEQVQIKHQKS